MNISYSIKTAVRGLTTNKSRSILTILGIVIGITAIILIVSIGKGAQDLILQQIQGLGSRTIVVIPGREPKGFSDSAQIFSDSLKEKDYEALQKKSNAPTLKNIMPLLFGGENASYGKETYRLTIFGVSDMASTIFDLNTEFGNFISPDDIKSQAAIVVIGSKVKEELFGSNGALGQKIKLKNKSYKIVGILPKKGQVSFFNFDEAALVPYTTAQKYIFGIQYYHRFIIESNEEKNIPQTAREVAATLRDQHGITNPDKDDFFIQTQADLANRLGVVTDVLTLFLVAVAAISLVVGGIGIMNIMLVSVTERTREIGLRKALGATEKDILIQFLLESVGLTGVGGLIGIVIGAGLSFFASLILSRTLNLSWNYTFPIPATIIGLLVSVGVGLVFGIYPARQASKKSPIEALRYE